MPLPVVSDCQNCGVCCLHMGYPTFLLPRAPLTPEQIEADDDLVRAIEADPRLRSDLEQGSTGEIWWHRLPETLRIELEDFIADYHRRREADGAGPDTLDDACFWYDSETRQCKHHPYRPQVCRDFSAGSRGCLEWRSYYRIGDSSQSNASNQ